MGDQYERKHKELRLRYLPFLEGMIRKLEVANDSNRASQLEKMRTLHMILVTSNKKLKLDTLYRCEEVLHRLSEKLDPSASPTAQIDIPGASQSHHNVRGGLSSERDSESRNGPASNSPTSEPHSPPLSSFVASYTIDSPEQRYSELTEATPRSPSPEGWGEDGLHPLQKAPIVIPIERRKSSTDEAYTFGSALPESMGSEQRSLEQSRERLKRIHMLTQNQSAPADASFEKSRLRLNRLLGSRNIDDCDESSSSRDSRWIQQKTEPLPSQKSTIFVDDTDGETRRDSIRSKLQREIQEVHRVGPKDWEGVARKGIAKEIFVPLPRPVSEIDDKWNRIPHMPINRDPRKGIHNMRNDTSCSLSSLSSSGDVPSVSPAPTSSVFNQFRAPVQGGGRNTGPVLNPPAVVHSSEFQHPYYHTPQATHKILPKSSTGVLDGSVISAYNRNNTSVQTVHPPVWQQQSNVVDHQRFVPQSRYPVSQGRNPSATRPAQHRPPVRLGVPTSPSSSVRHQLPHQKMPSQPKTETTEKYRKQVIQSRLDMQKKKMLERRPSRDSNFHNQSTRRVGQLHQKNAETVISPLDQLYSKSSEAVTGKGYGLQKFKIPKIKRPEATVGPLEQETGVEPSVISPPQTNIPEPVPSAESGHADPVSQPAVASKECITKEYIQNLIMESIASGKGKEILKQRKLLERISKVAKLFSSSDTDNSDSEDSKHSPVKKIRKRVVILQSTDEDTEEEVPLGKRMSERAGKVATKGTKPNKTSSVAEKEAEKTEPPKRKSMKRRSSLERLHEDLKEIGYDDATLMSVRRSTRKPDVPAVSGAASTKTSEKQLKVSDKEPMVVLEKLTQHVDSTVRVTRSKLSANDSNFDDLYADIPEPTMPSKSSPGTQTKNTLSKEPVENSAGKTSTVELAEHLERTSVEADAESDSSSSPYKGMPVLFPDSSSSPDKEMPVLSPLKYRTPDKKQTERKSNLDHDETGCTKSCVDEEDVSDIETVLRQALAEAASSLKQPNKRCYRKKKKGKKWASGTITRRPDHHSSCDAGSATCLLCSYSGKKLVSHYVSQHPDEEIPSCKLAPEVLKNQINEAAVFSEELTCAMCEVTCTDSTDLYEHMTSHTGEYRFFCCHCLYRNIKRQTVKNHINYMHKREDSDNVNEDPPFCDIDNIVIHVCSNCNYFQLDKEKVEKHCKSHENDAHVKEISARRKIVPPPPIVKPVPDQPEVFESTVNLREDETTQREKQCAVMNELYEIMSSKIIHQQSHAAECIAKAVQVEQEEPAGELLPDESPQFTESQQGAEDDMPFTGPQQGTGDDMQFIEQQLLAAADDQYISDSSETSLSEEMDWSNYDLSVTDDDTDQESVTSFNESDINEKILDSEFANTIQMLVARIPARDDTNHAAVDCGYVDGTGDDYWLKLINEQIGLCPVCSIILPTPDYTKTHMEMHKHWKETAASYVEKLKGIFASNPTHDESQIRVSVRRLSGDILSSWHEDPAESGDDDDSDAGFCIKIEAVRSLNCPTDEQQQNGFIDLLSSSESSNLSDPICGSSVDQDAADRNVDKPTYQSELEVAPVKALGSELEAAGDILDWKSYLEFPESTSEGDCGLTDSALYRCGQPSCSFGAKDASLLKDHLQVCDFGRGIPTIGCAHCQKQFKHVGGLIDHLRCHGYKSQKCSLCTYRNPFPQVVAKHMKTVHHIGAYSVVSATPFMSSNKEKMEYVLIPKAPEGKNPVSTKDGRVPAKLTYMPVDVKDIPKQAIFIRPLKCGMCSFSSIVRSNLVRHLMLHNHSNEVAGVTPINPPPCLERKELMFDKMTNLAASSILNKADKKTTPAEGTDIPKYIAPKQRLKCGVEGCSYLTVDETIFKHHLRALHGETGSFLCPHCGESCLNPDRLALHLKLHGPQLYKCGHCPYLHWKQTVMERHLSDKHSDKMPLEQVLRNILESPGSAITENAGNGAPARHKWKCCLCKYSAVTEKVILDHVLSTHGVHARFKCAFCQVKGSREEALLKHFQLSHERLQFHVIKTYVELDELELDLEKLPPRAEPLWKKGQVFHIRGIFLAEKELQVPDYSDEDQPSRKFPDFINPCGEHFACPKCQFKCKTRTDMRDHLYRELTYTKYVCTYCGMLGFTFAVLERHSAKQHEKDGRPQSISQMPIEVDTEDWVEKFLQHQEKIMNKKKDNEKKSTILDKAKSKTNSTVYDRQQPCSCKECGSSFRNIVGFTSHVRLIHLKIGKWKCSYCPRSHNNRSSLERHCKSEHPEKQPRVVLNPRSVQLSGNYWQNYYKECTTKDCVSTSDDSPSVHDTDKEVEIASSSVESSPTKPLHKCAHCPYSTMHSCDLRKHEKRHFVQKAYKCGHCDFEAHTEGDVRTHSKRLHTDREIEIVAKPMPSNPDIRPLRNVPLEKKTDVSDNIVSSSTADETEDSQAAEHKQFRCQYCRYRAAHVEVVREHWTAKHKASTDNFRYVVLSGESVPVLYKCNYCAESGTALILKQHITEHHPGQVYKVISLGVNKKRTSNVFECKICARTAMTRSTMKRHFQVKHPGKELLIIRRPRVKPISPPQTVTDTVQERAMHVETEKFIYTCGWCASDFARQNHFRDHHILCHPHQDVKMSQQKCDPAVIYLTDDDSEEEKEDKTSTQCIQHDDQSHSNLARPAELKPPSKQRLKIAKSRVQKISKGHSPTARKSTTRRAVAMKSTTHCGVKRGRQEQEVEKEENEDCPLPPSMYRKKRPKLDLNSIRTSMDVGDVRMQISVSAMMNAVNLLPSVVVDLTDLSQI